MQIPTLKSISEVRRSAKQIFEQIRTKDEVILVTKNNDKLSVIVSPDYFEAILEENESLWEELEMIRSKERTKKEKAFSLEDVTSGKI
jgi:PHD/YefM family antitoxin component YafN of YafNO toxin-antitoxin module